MIRILCLLILCFVSVVTLAQEAKLYGKITNAHLEPVAFASVQIKDSRNGLLTKEDGSFEWLLLKGKYTLVVSMVGYKPRVIELILSDDFEQNILLEEDEKNILADVVIKSKYRDRAEEVVKNTIRRKSEIKNAAVAYSCEAYIKAVEEDSMINKKKRKDAERRISEPEMEGDGIKSMTEVLIKRDFEPDNKIKEEKTGVVNRGTPENLFYLATIDGDFSLYNNFVDIPKLSVSPFVSPISFNGLIAYKYKTLSVDRKVSPKIYTISFKPTLMSNLTLEGEMKIQDSTFAILSTQYRLPKYHLTEYDFFEVNQKYEFINNTAWMVTSQRLVYYSKYGKGKMSGITDIAYSKFELNKHFPKKHFNNEISVTRQDAYEKDSSFWKSVRGVALTDREQKFMAYKDSIYEIQHSDVFLDSLAREINQVSWQKLLFIGQPIYNRRREETYVIMSAVEVIQPIKFGGPRFSPGAYYTRLFANKQKIEALAKLSYGFRNRDINGIIWWRHYYNPFSRAYYRIDIERNFQQLYEGDAYLNNQRPSNLYLSRALKFSHEIEVVNGLMVRGDFNFTYRSDLSGYKINKLNGGLFGSNDSVVRFDSHNALYVYVRLAYTPFQKYIREPKERIIIGSKWPTLVAWLKTGIPKIVNSQTNFSYLELGLEQSIKLAAFGTSRYNIKTGNFIDKKYLSVVDYKYQRRGHPFLFMNPDKAFQALDTTLPVFNRFYEGHFVHDFNGAFINRIPLLKKLQLKEVAGMGILIAPERNLKYLEAFAGIERVFKWSFAPLTKFKIGIYLTSSVANKTNGPLLFKVGFTTWDRLNNEWN